MEIKRTIIGTVLALLLVGGWYLGRSYLARTHPEWFAAPQPPQQAQSEPGAAPAPAASNPTVAPTSGEAPTSGPTSGPAPTTGAVATTVPTGPSIQPAPAGLAIWQPEVPPQPESAVLGSAVQADKDWAMQLVVNPMGASIEHVTLNDYKHPLDFKLPVKHRRPYVFQTPYDGMPFTHSLATRWISVKRDGNAQPTVIGIDGIPWTRENPGSSDPTTAAYSLTVASGGPKGTPVLRVIKTYTVRQRSDAAKGYEVLVKYDLEHKSGPGLTVKLGFNGPTLPPREMSQGSDRQVMGGYRNDKDQTIEVVSHLVDSFDKEKPTIDLGSAEGHPGAWAGTSSVYFSALAFPTLPGNRNAPGTFVGKVTATEHGLDNENIVAENRPVTIAYETVDVKLDAANASASMPLEVFLGPRWREVLTQGHYTAYPRSYHSTLVIKSGWCGFCTFNWLVNGMVMLLQAFHWLVGGFAGHGDWGLAIILLVCLVRGALHPITKRSQVQMMKMSKMGPEMERLKKKYGDDKEGLNKAMMGFYKEQGFAPILGCLPMFLQMPIWIALYSSLQTTFELRQAPFLWGWTWIKDLSKPDFLIQFSHPYPVPIIGWIFKSWTIDGINIMPVLLGVVFYLQQRFTPKPAAMTPEQAQQQKMMQWMTLLFPIMLYPGPSGLNLYILTSTTIGIIESKRIRDHIKEREELEKKEGPVIVDAAPTRSGKNRPKAKEAPPKKGGLAGWWAEMQEKIEQARREKGKPGKGR